MKISNQMTSALLQVFVVILLSAFVYVIHWFFVLRHNQGQTFLNYLGLTSARNQFDSFFFTIMASFAAFAIMSTVLEFHMSEGFRKLLMSPNSPYGKILQTGFNAHSIFLALIYCFVMAGASEEILFRGLIAKRLFLNLGFFYGNILQALIFWLMHLIILRLITGDWVSFMQLISFFTSFGMGLFFGYVNFRNNGQSIAPSWILHGSANFATFLSLAYVWPKT